jgi:protein phosphatase
MKLPDALEIAVRTDPGLVRSHNEDAVFADATLGLAILADGMGGYNAGEVASGMACTLLANNFSRLIPTCATQLAGAESASFALQQLVSEVSMASLAIFNAAQSQPQYAGMGTTLVMAWFYDNQLHVAHVGDSRLYRLRHNRLVQLTRDHSLLQEQLDNGMISPQEARYSHNRNLVTRALGVEAEVEVEAHAHEVQPGDIFILCSDGLNDMVEDEDITLTLQTLGGNLELAAEQLVHLANDNGGRDNISVILIRVLGEYSVPRGWWQKLLATLK